MNYSAILGIFFRLYYFRHLIKNKDNKKLMFIQLMAKKLKHYYPFNSSSSYVVYFIC